MQTQQKPLGPELTMWMTKAAALAEAQFQEADRIATHSLGVGGSSVERAAIVATLMQVLATNLNAMIANNRQ